MHAFVSSLKGHMKEGNQIPGAGGCLLLLHFFLLCLGLGSGGEETARKPTSLGGEPWGGLSLSDGGFSLSKASRFVRWPFFPFEGCDKRSNPLLIVDSPFDEGTKEQNE